MTERSSGDARCCRSGSWMMVVGSGVVSSVSAIGGDADDVLVISGQPGVVIEGAPSVVRVVFSDGVRFNELTLTRPTP